MLLPKDINPLNTLYYTGAVVLKTLESDSSSSIDFFELYYKLKQAANISFQSYIFTLDWLFILGSIKQQKGGKIEKCF